MSETDTRVGDGGPAFPVDQIEKHYNHLGELRVTDLGHDYKGMSLRDYFAAQIIGGYLSIDADAPDCREDSCDTIEQQAPIMARMAYAVADAMLAARVAKAEGRQMPDRTPTPTAYGRIDGCTFTASPEPCPACADGPTVTIPAGGTGTVTPVKREKTVGQRIAEAFATAPRFQRPEIGGPPFVPCHLEGDPWKLAARIDAEIQRAKEDGHTKEREACAAMLDAHAEGSAKTAGRSTGDFRYWYDRAAIQRICADNIRARSTTPGKED